LSIKEIDQPFTLYRHSGMFLAGIHHKQRLKTWIPAQTVPE
jgi:hypothetical protein